MPAASGGESRTRLQAASAVLPVVVCGSTLREHVREHGATLGAREHGATGARAGSTGPSFVLRSTGPSFVGGSTGPFFGSTGPSIVCQAAQVDSAHSRIPPQFYRRHWLAPGCDSFRFGNCPLKRLMLAGVQYSSRSVSPAEPDSRSRMTAPRPAHPVNSSQVGHRPMSCQTGARGHPLFVLCLSGRSS